MKDIRLGKYLISFHIAKRNTLSDKYFAEYSQHLKVGRVYTKKYFQSWEKTLPWKEYNCVLVICLVFFNWCS